MSVEANLFIKIESNLPILAIIAEDTLWTGLSQNRTSTEIGQTIYNENFMVKILKNNFGTDGDLDFENYGWRIVIQSLSNDRLAHRMACIELGNTLFDRIVAMTGCDAMLVFNVQELIRKFDSSA
jgi:hypothetical protein